MTRHRPFQITIADIENVETVFKGGVGHDPDPILATVRGRYGQY